MNAKPRDVQAGWEIFRALGYEATLAEINRELQHRKFNPVSERTHRHYEKLARYGYEQYLPINRLDVETLKDPVGRSPLASRYKVRSVAIDATVVLIHGKVLLSLSGETELLGESEATVVVSLPTSEGEARIEDPTKLEGLTCLLRLGDESDGRAATVTLAQYRGDDERVRLSLSFAQLLTNIELFGRQILAPTTIRISVTTDQTEFLVDVVRTLHALFQAVDSARIACDEALVRLDTRNQFVLPPPRALTLTKQSPLVIELGGSWPVLSAFAGTVLLYISWWKGHNAGRLLRKQGDYVASEAEVKSEEARRLRIRNDLDEFTAKVVKDGLIPRYIEGKIRGALPDPVEGEGTSERLKILVDNQLLPSMEELLLSGADDVEIEGDLGELPELPGDDAEKANGPASAAVPES